MFISRVNNAISPCSIFNGCDCVAVLLHPLIIIAYFISSIPRVFCYVPLHEHVVGRLNGYVGAAAYRNADVCLRECRGVVDAIAHHGDHLVLSLQLLSDIKHVMLHRETHSIHTHADT